VLECLKLSVIAAGLEWNFSNEKAIMSHERLAIVDPSSGKPLLSEDKQLILAANGEIYNTENCVSNLKENITFKLKVTAKLF
jgi:asparagine synthase (glutamine-hydrolysing)